VKLSFSAPPASDDAIAEDLERLYTDFQVRSAPYRVHAVCRPGCARCCIEVGNVDATTLEGLRIYNHLRHLPRPRRMELTKALARNRRLKQRPGHVRCPFLQKNETCLIYPVRPFSCRQLYSLTLCGDQGPTVHRQAVALARETVAALQRLDANGYCGHLSFVLELLDDDDFRSFYLAGGFDPARIMAFARPRGLAINRIVAPALPAAGRLQGN
jgi:Fe-S-cluster containining protein